ncbi:hypothetical protein EDB92DRAFT_361065 [Lactarius akahatsu]|uniref:F-box domain-containing protein n=1 Tax=Lactarius akahatsu TaxID=416441 RepID=A0AAD4Q8D4_9AGAM|nr:hypothetical protein EDB92DRAFT_361065 [Lactarius akahatsu]
MVCVPPSISLPASDSPSHYLTSDSTLLPSRLTWYRYPTILGQRDPAQSLVVDTLHKPEFRLPAEILDEIFSYATPPTLTRLALVSHTFQEVAARLLYRNIPSLSVSHTTTLVETLASKPCLAAHTRTCEIGDMTFLDANRKGLLPPSFFEQLRSALHSMHRLTELTFLLNGPTSHVLVGAPFKLTKLTVSCDFDATFASWLTEQVSLRTAIFCGTFAEGVTLPADALPSLRRVTASPPTLAVCRTGAVNPRSRLVPRAPMVSQPRGVADVDPSNLCVKRPARFPQDHLAPFRANGHSLILAGDYPFWPKLDYEVRAARSSGSITDDILSGLPPILSRFTGLRSVVLFSKNRYDALHTAAGSRALAEAWHAHCSSLESVTLPGATYVHQRNYGWNTPRDLAELLETREQPTQPQHYAAAAAQGDKGRILLRGFKSDLGMERNGSGASMVAVAA